MPVYLDDNGEPISQAKQYLDDDGNVIGSPEKKERGMFSQSPEAYKDRAIGMGKAVIGMGHNTLNLMNRLPSPARPFGGTPIHAPDFEAALEPENPAQSFGKTGTEIAAFFAPGGAITRGVNAVERGAAALPKVVQTLARGGARVGLEGASAAGVAATQGGDPLAAGAAGAGGVLVGKAVERFAGPLMSGVLGASRRSHKYGATPGKTVADEGISGVSLTGIAEKINAAKERVKKALDSILSSPAAQTQKLTPGGAVRARIDAELPTAGAKSAGYASEVENFGEWITNRITQLSGGRQVLTPSQVTQLKREVGDGISWDTDAAVKKLNAMKRHVYHILDDMVDRAVPESKALNAKEASLIEASRAVKSKMAGRWSQSRMAAELQRIAIASMIGGSVGAWQRDPVKGVGAALAARGLGSTAVRSNLARAMASKGNVMPKLAGVGASAITEEE